MCHSCQVVRRPCHSEVVSAPFRKHSNNTCTWKAAANLALGCYSMGTFCCCPAGQLSGGKDRKGGHFLTEVGVPA